ncbi:hypothetical protein B0I37DRAFT_419550 [Chaetomium sp. MPI-CAGE-AT-0009]|nr:hypothetical protein B0I37DRAFT_419550 [Chaetomium sp. MPI-CAGE-AT-0009]
MGLPLRNSTAFIPTNPGGPSLGGPSTAADSDLDPDLSEPLSYHYTRSRRTNRPSRLHPHATSHCLNPKAGSELSPCSRPIANNNNTTHSRHSTHHRRLHRHRLRQNHHTHYAKPRIPWAADADEGRALARSTIRLPGERGGGRSISRSRSSWNNSSSGGRGEDGSQNSSPSSTSGRRPPSLERQDAFRDEKTAKRRRQRHQQRQQQWREWEEWEGDEQEQEHDGGLRDEQAEVAELYRMGLLYDDEHERGEGFSLDGIVRDEPAYSLRVRPAKRARGEERARDGVFLSAVDLAFSAFGADQAWAGWLLSGSGSGSGFASSDAPVLEAPRPWMETAHDTPRLTVVYELADDAVSAMSVDDDFLDSVSVSDISYCGGEEGDEMAWAMLNRGDGNAMSTTMDLVEADGEVDPWVVLGHDGS